MQRAFVLVAAVSICGGVFVAWRPHAAEAPPSQAQFDKGAALFSQICSHCHGPHMVNPGTIAFDLRKFPHDDRARFFHSVRNGKNSMPPWKDVLTNNDIEALWAYVRTGGKEP